MKLSKYRLIIAASAASSDGLMFDSYGISLQLDDLVVRSVTCKVSGLGFNPGSYQMFFSLLRHKVVGKKN